MERNIKLEEKIYNYIRENEQYHIDYIVIIRHFSRWYISSLIDDAITHLRVNGFIDKVNVGMYYYFKTIKNYE